uniref:Uncharacterized LOC100176485 n=1 Tax=Ciona intestinalis TaxID=7719 RepID=F7AG70_CIOIN|nr:uncharacterized protein LOC100176485 isoform X2 [Ciona intestinalis]|eukprot:XP_002129012.1 uncharacterized protein LOC100176485 isoform X2 [Ciona intestinalis]
MSGALRLIILATIMAAISLTVEAEFATIRVPQNFGCSNGRKDGLFRHRDVSACKGTWEGHVRDAPLCSLGWHVCSWNDTEQLSGISWYQTVHIEGCYAINAANRGDLCTECSSENDDLAGIGADCPHQNQNDRSCFGRGKVTASSRMFRHRPCEHKPWMTGVVCCRDRRKGSTPIITVSPVSSVQSPAGVEIVLKCKAVASPLPEITWYKNGFQVNTVGVTVEEVAQDKLVYSKLRISPLADDVEGLYMCKAENRHGIAVSYTSDVTVIQARPKLVACRDKAKQSLLHGGVIAACGGKWKGTVKKSSKQLCAKGWHVCGLRDRSILNKLTWAETVSLSGCYAYDAATSDHFACNRCSRRLKGNSMAGIGANCGSLERSKTSCLNKGRIGVWQKQFLEGGNSTDEFDVTATVQDGVSAKTRSSCRYHRGVTTGVMCCKKKGSKRKDPVCSPGCENDGVCRVGNFCECPAGRSGFRCEVLNTAAHGKKCATPCGPNSHCNRKGVCKCDKGFKSTKNSCIPRKNRSKGKNRGRRCRGVNCQNGGRCSRGSCICPPLFTGQYCETAFVDQSQLTLH